MSYVWHFCQVKLSDSISEWKEFFSRVTVLNSIAMYFSKIDKYFTRLTETEEFFLMHDQFKTQNIK